MEKGALVFNSGTYERADLNKKTEQELYDLWRQDAENEVQCYTLDEFSAAFNDEALSHQDWLFFIDVDEIYTGEKDPLEGYSDDFRNGIAYVMERLDEDDKAIIRAECNKAYKMHLVPDRAIVDDSLLIDLLEEYGDDNDLPEGWYENEYDSSIILTMI